MHVFQSVSYWNLLKPICLIALWRVFCSNCCWICAISLDDIKICFAIEGKKQEFSSCKTAIAAYFGTDDSSLAPILGKNFATATSTFSLSRGGGGGRLNQFGILLSLRKKGGILYLKRRKYCQHKKSSHIKWQWLFCFLSYSFQYTHLEVDFFEQMRKNGSDQKANKKLFPCQPF